MKQKFWGNVILYSDRKGFKFKNRTYKPVASVSISNNLKKGILTVYPTTDCNLRCIYCYASSGSEKKELSPDTFKTLLEDIVDPSLLPELQLHFHGGGEPTSNPKLFKTLIELFKQKCTTLYVKDSYSLTTNGVFGAEVMDLIIRHSISTSLSWDGPDDIQNTQRPLANGRNSHAVVYKNMIHLQKAGLLRRVRITITPLNILHLKTIVHFLNNEGIKDIQMEPASILGRQNEKNAVNLEQFISHFTEAYILCCQLGITLSGISTMIFKSPNQRFCGAFGWNYVLTSNGEISACTRVQNRTDAHAESFILGPWIPGSNPMTFSREKRKKLQDRTTDNLPECSSCPLRYHCAGGCPMTHPQSYDSELKRTDDLPCRITLFAIEALLEAVDKGFLPPGWKITE